MDLRGKNDYIQYLQETLSKMMYLSLSLLTQAEQYFINKTPAQMEKVLLEDAQMDSYELEIERRGLEVLALYAPEANDLRYIVGTLRVVTDLERIGDLCSNIVRTVSWVEEVLAIGLFGLEVLFGRVKQMLENATDAFIRGDVDLAFYVLTQDQVVDDLNGSVFKRSVEQITKTPESAMLCVHYLLISRYLERIADHATNISETAIFIQKGQEVKHQKLKDLH